MVLRWIGDTVAGQNHARDIEVTRTVSQADFFVDAKTRELHADCRKGYGRTTTQWSVTLGTLRNNSGAI